MDSHPIAGTADWTSYDLVRDVPALTAQIVVGAYLFGSGEAWLDSGALHVVDPSTPLTP